MLAVYLAVLILPLTQAQILDALSQSEGVALYSQNILSSVK
jgi:hypothetical protein